MPNAIPISAAVESKACLPWRVLREIFGDLNQEARKTGGDQEFLEVPGFMASRLNLIPAFLRDNLS